MLRSPETGPSQVPAGFSLVTVLLAVANLGPFPAAATEYEFEWANPKPQGNALHALAFESATVGYAIGGLGAVLRTEDGGQTWTALTRFPETQPAFRDVLVLGPGHLLAVGGGIFRSLDGGETWINLGVFTTAQDLAVIPGTGGILSAIGSFGDVRRSTDGGETWEMRPSPGIRVLRDQFWIDGSTAYLVGDNVARRTTDGGETWLAIPGISENVVSYTDVHFADAQNGWILEHFTTFRTTDGGASWFPRHANPPQGPIYQEEALFLDLNRRFVITNLEGAEIWETTNDGLAWTRRYQRQRTQGYTDIERLPDGTLAVSSTDGDLLRSTDSGLTWTNFVTSPGDLERTTLQAIEILPSGKGFASGTDGVWLVSEDAGSSWEFGPGPGIDTPNAIAFRNDALGLAGGYGPIGQTKIARTTDGAATWTLHTISPTYTGYVQQIAFPTDQIAYVVTHGGSGINFVHRSTDGGQTWHVRNQAGTDLRSIFFLDANTGFVGGGEFSSDAALWKTTDGGASWVPVLDAGLPHAGITDMHWSDASTGLVASIDGVCRTTNGGQSWSCLFNTVLRVSFRDALHGYAGSYFDRRIFETTDGGESWSSVLTLWEDAPFEIEATPDGFLALGGGSVIVRAQVAGTAGLPAGQGASPAVGRWSEVRVWPNPSEPEAALTFGVESPTAGPVELRIYDVGGRLIDALTRRVEAGSASITWQRGAARGGGSAASFPAGIYYVEARFATGERAQGRFAVRR